MRKNTKSGPSKKRSRAPKRRGRPEDYQVVLHWSDEDEAWIATLPAWQNAQTHGATLEEATRSARDVLTMLLESARRRGERCPEPTSRYSGNLRLRLPVSLHARLVREAEREGVSLNQWLVTKLAG
jgi:predicted HicB family RNase H-like nuclease